MFHYGFLLYATVPADAATVKADCVAMPPTITAATIVFSDSLRSSSDISAPILANASNACAGSVKIALTHSAGFSRTVSACATSAVITTSFPFSS